MAVDMEEALASVADWGQLCAQAHAALGAVTHQVEAMNGFFATGAPAAGCGWIDVLEDTVGAAQQLEEDALKAASSLVGKLQARVKCSEAARATARRLQVFAAVQLNRQHNEHRSPLLLHLPDDALEIVARKIGKRARLLCSKLCLAYGPPGAVLAPPFADPHNPLKVYTLTRADAAAMQSWRHPVRLLDLSRCLFADKLQGIMLAQALPTLRELRCDDRYSTLVVAVSPLLPHPSLTSLHTRRAWHDLRCVVACAPHLRALHIGKYKPYMGRRGSMVWEALASLPSLQSLHLPLTPSAGFCSALQCLTALTHLGLVLQPDDYGSNDGARAPSSDAALWATRALSALPLLASIDLSNFQMLGGTLGPALQALPALRILALHQERTFDDSDDDDDDAPPPARLPAGCLPSLGAMRSLEELTLTGDAVVGSQELQRAAGGVTPPLKAVVLQLTDNEHVPSVCDLLARLTAMTSLGLHLCSGAYGHQEGQLSAAVAQLTQLRRLHVRSMDGEFVPCAAPLPALTCLEMHLVRIGPVWSNLRAVEAFSGLRRLVLMSENTTAAQRVQYMLAVKKLRLLEDAEVGHAQWTEADLAVLLPPRGQLTRLLLAMPFASGSRFNLAVPAPAVPAAVERLESFGVRVVLRHGRG